MSFLLFLAVLYLFSLLVFNDKQGSDGSSPAGLVVHINYVHVTTLKMYIITNVSKTTLSCNLDFMWEMIQKGQLKKGSSFLPSPKKSSKIV